MEAWRRGPLTTLTNFLLIYPGRDYNAHPTNSSSHSLKQPLPYTQYRDPSASRYLSTTLFSSTHYLSMEDATQAAATRDLNDQPCDLSCSGLNMFPVQCLHARWLCKKNDVYLSTGTSGNDTRERRLAIGVFTLAMFFFAKSESSIRSLHSVRNSRHARGQRR